MLRGWWWTHSLVNSSEVINQKHSYVQLEEEKQQSDKEYAIDW